MGGSPCFAHVFYNIPLYLLRWGHQSTTSFCSCVAPVSHSFWNEVTHWSSGAKVSAVWVQQAGVWEKKHRKKCNTKRKRKSSQSQNRKGHVVTQAPEPAVNQRRVPPLFHRTQKISFSLARQKWEHEMDVNDGRSTAIKQVSGRGEVKTVRLTRSPPMTECCCDFVWLMANVDGNLPGQWGRWGSSQFAGEADASSGQGHSPAAAHSETNTVTHRQCEKDKIKKALSKC